jgi:hypothetical protein
MYAYCFYNTVFTDEDGFYSASVEAPGKEADSEIVWLRGNYDGVYMLYATQKGAEDLKEFEEGKYYSAVIIDPESAWNDIGLSVIDEIDAESKNSSEKITADVTDLKNVERLDIRVYDETESFYKTYGALYQMKGNWFYVNYESLGNEHFDADGNFSYRRGSVELSKLSDALSKRIHSFNEGKKLLYTVCTYEDQQYGSYNEYDSYDPTLGIVIFWVVYSLICFALPAAIAVLGCVLARLKPLGRPKYWYIVSLIAVIWIVLSVALMIVILV